MSTAGSVAPNPFDLTGKVSVVTGASSGIGAEIARALAAAGSAVVLVGRSTDRLAVAAEAVAAVGAEHHEVAADLRDDGAAEAVVAAALHRFGRIDVLVHSAGIYAQASLADTTDEIFDGQWETNVRGPFRLTRAAHPHLGRGASVVFVSSMSGHVGSPDDAAYCASKGAVELLVKALATELAPAGVRVNAVAPGNVHTPINAGLITPEVQRGIEASTPAGRVGVVTDISPAVVYLASDAAAYVHGASLRVDGGFTAQ
ncbi:SDR family oxidoreductase [Actinosynnema sp. NPDC047251]|uniref:Short-chain dehydrogenase/reductase n=1 Tax=Saccharothrix espanaensis (strain ATCC 51144 / DSM 44229 / JCM 9112 / NBRC 15066 / NRRL 15764) TaxID=1179773 RepID=K0JP94_SACES|nr:SDR family oxidoreductase [Saccharothrix espanaensis]CCH28405.1 Short-chain dehydrogenase/reductase [Saccharothrix espanaensis DSM 44229]